MKGWKTFVVKEFSLFLLAVISLYLTSYFHFYGQGMWNKGALPQIWADTNKITAAYFIFVVIFIFIAFMIKNRRVAIAFTTLYVALLVLWIMYSSLITMNLGGGEDSYLSMLFSLSSDVFLALLSAFGLKLMWSHVKESK